MTRRRCRRLRRPRQTSCPGGASRRLVGASGRPVGGLGVWLGLLAVRVGAVAAIGWLVPLSVCGSDLDPLGGFFIAVTGGGRDSRRRLRDRLAAHHLPGVPLAVLPVFVAAMLLVPAAGSVTTFLLAWELMALASLVLVLAEHTRAEVRSAGVFYAVMTQSGFVAVLIGLMVLTAAGGADRFAVLARGTGVSHAPSYSSLTVVGFGSKAGLVPLHAWLPRAHPEAPSPVSALMSAAMVNLGSTASCVSTCRCWDPARGGGGWCCWSSAAISALYGVLAGDGGDRPQTAAGLFDHREHGPDHSGARCRDAARRRRDAPHAATIAMAAAMLHLVAHAAFKTLGFLAAGSVLAGDRAARPGPAGRAGPHGCPPPRLFGVAALGACGLPLGAGFVSEWLLVQSLIHAASGHGTWWRWRRRWRSARSP